MTRLVPLRPKEDVHRPTPDDPIPMPPALAELRFETIGDVSRHQTYAIDEHADRRILVGRSWMPRVRGDVLVALFIGALITVVTLLVVERGGRGGPRDVDVPSTLQRGR